MKRSYFTIAATIILVGVGVWLLVKYHSGSVRQLPLSQDVKRADVSASKETGDNQKKGAMAGDLKDSAYADAYQLYKDGSYSEALRVLDYLKEKSPDPSTKIKAAHLIGYIYLKMEDRVTSLGAFQDFLILYPQHPLSQDALLRVAYLSISLDHPKERSKEYLRQFIEANPTSVEAAKAAKTWARLVDSDPDSPMEERLDAFRFVLEYFPDSPVAIEASYSLANLMSIAPSYNDNQRIVAYQRILEDYPSSDEAQMARQNIASLLWKISERNPTIASKEEVRRAFEEILANPADAAQAGHAAMQIAALTLELERARAQEIDNYTMDYDSVIEACETALQEPGISWEDSATTNLMKGEAYYFSGDHFGAIEHFNTMIEVYSELDEAHLQLAFANYMLASTYRELGQNDQAISTYVRVVEEYQDADNFAGNNVQANSMYWIAHLEYSQNNFEAALEAAERVRSDYPDSEEGTSILSLIEIIKSRLSGGGK